MIKEIFSNLQIKNISRQFELDRNGILQTPNSNECFFQIGNNLWGQHTCFDDVGEYRCVNSEFGKTLTRVKEIKLNQK